MGRVRRPPWILAGIGTALLLAGWFYDLAFAGLPYQDPPPALAARYARHAAIASALYAAGAAAAGVGLLGGLLGRLARRRR